MFKSSVNNDFQLKVSGYDYSTSFTHIDHEDAKNIEYWAPEMISKEDVGDQKFKVDIWALGILTFYIIEGLTPFYDESGLDSELLTEE